MSFAALKRNRNKAVEALKSQIDSEKSGYGDDRYWKLTVDNNGNGYAVLRFLPAPDGEEVPYVKCYKHAFKNEVTGKWYIENSRTTLGETDPVSEANSELWNTGLESNKEIARKRKRNVKFIVNVLVIEDSKAPENNGKVFLFEAGPKIFSKIEGAITPEFEDEQAFNPFDFWEGADFKLKARQVSGQRNYDKSEFVEPAPLFDGDETKLEELYGKLHSLKAEVAEDKFKSYDQLKARFEMVVGGSTKPAAPRTNQQVANDELPFDMDDTSNNSSSDSTEEEDDLLATYGSLLNDD